jgi:hypothetical protein
MNSKRHDHGGVSHVQKERGATPSETTPHGTTDPADCTKLRTVFASPLAADLLILAVAAGLLIGGFA